MTTGRNFDEILRVIDSLQLTAEHAVATPAQWQPGENVIIAGSVCDEQAQGEVTRTAGRAAAVHAHRPGPGEHLAACSTHSSRGTSQGPQSGSASWPAEAC